VGKVKKGGRKRNGDYPQSNRRRNLNSLYKSVERGKKKVTTKGVGRRAIGETKGIGGERLFVSRRLRLNVLQFCNRSER